MQKTQKNEQKVQKKYQQSSVDNAAVPTDQSEESFVNNALAFIQRGSVLTKVRSIGRRYHRNFFVDSDCITLRYRDSHKNQCMRRLRGNQPDMSKISIQHITEIRDGVLPGSVLYPLRNPLSREAVPCFSIVFGEQMKTLDLIAPNTDTKDKWVRGLQHLVKRYKDPSPEQQEISWLKEKFQEADVNNDGFLVIDEVLRLMQALSFSPIETDRVGEVSKAKKLTINEFIDFYKTLTRRDEIDEIFKRYADGNNYMGATELKRFFKQDQGEKLDSNDAKTLITSFEPCPELKKQLLLSSAGFHDLFASEQMNIKKPLCRRVYQDMTQPLSHYYINSSHNTYLEGHQLYGNSSVQQYIRVLNHRCRCVELDVWDGSGGEPIIYHGYTMTTKILFKDVLEGINEFAFKKSDYPLILSIENHCSVEQQRLMARYLRETFGSQLLTEPLDKNCTSLPSPESLKRRVIVKGKKLPEDILDSGCDEASMSEDDEAANIEDEVVQQQVKKQAASEEKHRLATELSDCVVICQSASFKSFEASAAKLTFANISSFDEDKAVHLSRSEPVQFVRHNAWQLSRTYPAGRRTQSGNYNPVPMWNVGCQVVALNFQTRDDPLLLNYGRFEDNGACGYVLKPEFMRSRTSTFDHTKPQAKNQSRTLTVRVISGFILPKKTGDRQSSILDPYVKVEIIGIPADCSAQQTKTIPNNGFHPVWNTSLPTFTITCPDLALVNFRVIDDESSQSDVMVAQYCLPFNCIQSGYRMIALRDISGNIVNKTSLFVHVTIGP